MKFAYRLSGDWYFPGNEKYISYILSGVQEGSGETFDTWYQPSDIVPAGGGCDRWVEVKIKAYPIYRDGSLSLRPPGNDSHKPEHEDYDRGWNECWGYFTSLIRGQDAADLAMIIHAKMEARANSDLITVQTAEKLLQRGNTAFIAALYSGRKTMAETEGKQFYGGNDRCEAMRPFLTKEELYGFCLGNKFKHIRRHHNRGGREDLVKGMTVWGRAIGLTGNDSGEDNS